jgi:hypothetical protein
VPIRCSAAAAGISRIANGNSSPRISRLTAPPRTRRPPPAATAPCTMSAFDDGRCAHGVCGMAGRSFTGFE